MPRFLRYLLIIVVIVLSILFYFGSRPLSSERTTFMIVGEPVEVVSYNQQQDRWTIVQLTKDAYISGVFGLGEYSLEALWKLGQSESDPTAIIRESLAEELGVTIPYLIIDKNETFTVQTDSFSRARSVFQLSNFLPYLQGKYITSIDPWLFLQLMSKVNQLNPSNTNKYIVGKNAGLVSKTAKDGLNYMRFDRAAFDTRTGDAFEEIRVRKEAQRVVVYNTTQKPGVGSRIGRMVSKLGALVVAVKNDSDAKVKLCELAGSEQALATHTRKRMQSIFGCQSIIDPNEDQGDLVIRVGEEYAKRYIIDAQ